MPRIIGRQLDTFEDTVMKAHYEAMEVHDLVEGMRFAAKLAESLREAIAQLHELGGSFNLDEDADAQESLSRMMATMIQLLSWARRRRGDGHPIDEQGIEAHERAIAAVSECKARLKLIAEENAEDPSLPSLEELKRDIAAASSKGYRSAQANAAKVFGQTAR